MNALRNTRLFVLVGLFAVLLIGISAVNADASCYSYKTFYSPGYSHFTSYSTYPSYCSYGTFNYGNYWPAVSYGAAPLSYPVTTYDSFGRPVVVWQTGYSTLPVSYAP
jgi:hypothetical protein